jgi:XTP/dITP diphosphohydrolase
VSACVLLATRSTGKLAELRPLFAEAGIAALTLDDAGIPESPDESGLERFDTFEENALAKARYFTARQPEVTVIADDSGLEVIALGGAPGVRTKRFSGRDDLRGQALDDANNAALLRALAGAADRRARYVCVAAMRDARGDERTFRGETAGRILDAPRGTGGFGYDPYFLSDEVNVTFAEIDRSAKERVSHRGRAFARVVAALRAG